MKSQLREMRVIVAHWRRTVIFRILFIQDMKN